MGALVSLVAGALGIDRTLAGIVTAIAAILLASGALWGGYALIKGQGADEVRTEIERQNHEAGINGAQARSDRADCVASGGVYDFRTGRCVGAPAGNR